MKQFSENSQKSMQKWLIKNNSYGVICKLLFPFCISSFCINIQLSRYFQKGLITAEISKIQCSGTDQENIFFCHMEVNEPLVKSRFSLTFFTSIVSMYQYAFISFVENLLSHKM